MRRDAAVYRGRTFVLLTLSLPPINPHASDAVVKTVYAAVGEELGLGAKLFDLTVDLSNAALVHDCPPVSSYRVVLRDKVWLRRIEVTAGQTVNTGEPLALFSTEPDEPLDAEPGRAVRVTIAGVVFRAAPWDEVTS